MILHVVALRWNVATTESDVERLLELLERVRDGVPALAEYRFGPDLGLREGNGSFAVVARVADEDGLTAYLEHPLHLEVREQIARMAESRTAVQIAV